MTVIASTFDVPGIYGQGPGKGTQVLNAVAAVQATVNAAPANSVQLAASLAQLNLLQIEAVDYILWQRAIVGGGGSDHRDVFSA